MRALYLVLMAGLATPVLALPLPRGQEPEGLRIYTPGQFGVTAETPSRIAASREEMNRGRNAPADGPAAPQATALVARAGLVCTVAEAAVIGRTRDGGALVEIDCVEGGGVIIADGDPVQVTDCLDLAADAGQAGPRQRVVTACRLPGNAGLGGPSQSARN